MYFNQVEFGKRLQECRKLKELTQEELAEMVGVEKAAYKPNRAWCYGLLN